jgi:beta-lactamase class A
MKALKRLFVICLVASTNACASLPPVGSSHPPAPPALSARLQELATAFPGKVGIAVLDIRAHWRADSDGESLYPQQSVSKLWVSMAVFDAIDRGRLALTDPVLVRRQDMSVFNQPIQKKLVDGVYATTIADLLVYALAKSDNAANDILVRKVGGSGVVRRWLAAHRLAGVRPGPQERVLQSQIAGVTWRPEYSFGQAFWTARDAVAPNVRAARLQAYLADPADGATPDGVVEGLSLLAQGRLLSPASTQRLIGILQETSTGPARLKAGLAAGWSIAHKTGTGQDLGDLSTGYNDVGLLTAPDGQTYAVAVMIASTRAPIAARQTLMADVARAVVHIHDGLDRAGAVPSQGLEQNRQGLL